MLEFRRWCPSLRALRLHSGDAKERDRLRRERLADVASFDVVVTTYEMLKGKEMRATLTSAIVWQCVVLDEGHRVKNEGAQISAVVAKIKRVSMLLLTGTPLQNNLHELWGLLHILHPVVFPEGTSGPFDDAFDLASQGRGSSSERRAQKQTRAAEKPEKKGSAKGGGMTIDRKALQVSVLLCTVTYSANRAHNLTRPP